MPNDKNKLKIQRFECKTRAGNTLSFFYNPENDLVVVDLVHKDGRGGNEFVRRTLNEKALLKGIPPLPPEPKAPPAPPREKMEHLGTSCITFKDKEDDTEIDRCFGYLMNFEDRGVFDAVYGKVDVTPEEAKIHNEAFDKMIIEGLDKNCEVGQCGSFYINAEGGDPDRWTVHTWLGTVVSEKVMIDRREQRVSFRRKGKLFETTDKRPQIDECCVFQRIT